MRIHVLITYLTESVILSSLFKLLKNRGQITSITAFFSFKVFRKEFMIPLVSFFSVTRFICWTLDLSNDQFSCYFNHIFGPNPWLFKIICKFLLIWRSIPLVKNCLNILSFINMNQLYMRQFFCNKSIVESYAFTVAVKEGAIIVTNI